VPARVACTCRGAWLSRSGGTRHGNSRRLSRAGSGGEQSERGRAHVLVPDPGGCFCPQHAPRTSRDSTRVVSGISLLIWPLARAPPKQRDERCAEAGLARTPLAKEHDQLLPTQAKAPFSPTPDRDRHRRSRHDARPPEHAAAPGAATDLEPSRATGRRPLPARLTTARSKTRSLASAPRPQPGQCCT
jgi:hypothetical protein